MDTNQLLRIIFYLFIVAIASLASGLDFTAQNKREKIYESKGLSGRKWLRDYLPSLKNTRGDTEVLFYDSRKDGGVVLVLGGTHPNEPAGYITTVVMAENLKVDQGTVIIIPRANASAFTATEPQEAFPNSISLTNRSGRERRFRVGSRYTNMLDGWPDPIVYCHYPSGQLLSGAETRNLNRSFPGRENGTLTERVAWAITEIVRKENVDLLIDLHEAAPEYPVINALVTHENGKDIAAMAAVDLEMRGINLRLEISPKNFRGLSHREIGDFTESKAVLLETAGALQGRLRGPTDEDIVINSRDALYHRASELGKLEVDFPEEGLPLEMRVGRHLESIQVLCETMSLFEPENAMSYSRIPSYDEIIKHGVGFYLGKFE